MAQLTIVPKIHRRYIYGTDYIDEVVSQHNFTTTGAQSTYHVLQDANWDVIALANTSGTLAEQYALDPYGQRFAAERVNADGTLTTLDPLTGAATFLTRNGLFANPYTGNLENRARTLNSRLLRMNQRDPNESALILTSSMALNGQSRFLGLSVNGSAQYQDGMSLYQYVRGNPITGTDSSGLFAYFDQMMSASTQAQLGTQYLDPAASTVDAMKGIAFLASDRNRAMDDLLGTESQEYDFSRIDTALEIYDTIQMAQLTLFGVGAAKSVLKVGAGFFKGMARRLGGLRTRIVEALERGHNAVERLIGRGEGWLKHLDNSGGHIFDRHVGRSDSYLLGRLQRRPNIGRASTYLNEAIAEAMVARTIRNNPAKIQTWLRNSAINDPLDIKYTHGSAIGRGVDRTGVFNADKTAVVRLGKDGRGGYYFVTSFTEP